MLTFNSDIYIFDSIHIIRKTIFFFRRFWPKIQLPGQSDIFNILVCFVIHKRLQKKKKLKSAWKIKPHY
jgi:hypothetical protein